MPWETVTRSGQIGRKKDALKAAWDAQYGTGNWRKAWCFNNRTIDKLMAFQVCEDGYYVHSFSHEEVWVRLLAEAREIYDMVPEEVRFWIRLH